MKIKTEKVSIVGLGYVGLPLAVLLSKHFSVSGFDISEKRVAQLRNNVDITGEVSKEELSENGIHFSYDPKIISDADFIIITVPTPITKSCTPDLTFLTDACRLVGTQLKKNSVVIFESTVYPGCTEEVCLPILEKYSSFVEGQDFSIAYSPERVNPGDKSRSISDITKVVSASNQSTLDRVAKFYKKAISAGVYCAETIKTAEAAKIIENIQRDLNIALMNELSVIFKLCDIDTQQVLNAAATKWNFIKFVPGLVGGHCISVDPYYLSFKSNELGHIPELILAGRNVNEGMPSWIASQVVKALSKKGLNVLTVNILILGATFKENCPDFRNSKALSLVNELRDFGARVTVFDPYAEDGDHSDFSDASTIIDNEYDAIIYAVPHDIFKHNKEFHPRNLGKNGAYIADLKSMFEKSESDFRL